jgi:C-terminal processing protease CtpA/Prc
MKKHSLSPILSSVALVFALAIGGCGGGGSGSTQFVAPPPPTPAPSGPTWQAGVYEPSEEFVAQCIAPRTGNDPFTGEPYPDVAGSALTEKLWLRSFTDETYLWFDEVPDNNPDNFTVAEYFAQLKTTELTASGKPKDNFHFSEPTDEYNERTQAGTSAGYGVSWAFIASSAPRELRVRYVEPNSPASTANIPRGARLLRIDGIDFVNTNSGSDIDAINAALFPSELGVSHTFDFVTADGTELSVELTTAVIELTPVQNVRVLDTPAGRMGYMQFNSFITPAQSDLISAFQTFVDEAATSVVLDLRYNGGGSLALASQIAYMVAGPNQTNGKIFDSLIYNSKRQQDETIPFYNREIDYAAGVFTNNVLPSPEFTKVYVLSTGNTCSASESLINGLRGIDVEVVLIGDTTCGKPFGFVPEDNCGTTYFTIQIQGANDKGFGEFSDGFSPSASPVFDDQVRGCSVDDDFSQPLGSADEGMLAAAIQFAENGTCPSNPAAPASVQRKIISTDGPVIRSPNPYLESILLDDRTLIKSERQ